MRKLIAGAFGAILLMAALPGAALAAPLAPVAEPAPARVTPAAWVLRCHTVWLRRHRHHHPGWRRVPARSCHRVHI